MHARLARNRNEDAEHGPFDPYDVRGRRVCLQVRGLLKTVRVEPEQVRSAVMAGTMQQEQATVTKPNEVDPVELELGESLLGREVVS